MTDLTPNHPAVEAADAALRAWMADLSDALPDDMMVYVLAAVLPHLTADDLRDTPAGRALMAEGWDRGVADNERGWQHAYAGHDVDPDDPLAECQTCETPTPYRGGDA